MSSYRLLPWSTRNDPRLVNLLKSWLNRTVVVSPRAQLRQDGVFCQQTRTAVEGFQRLYCISSSDGGVGIRTWMALAVRGGNRAVTTPGSVVPAGRGVPAWLIAAARRPVRSNVDLPDFDIPTFFRLYNEEPKIAQYGKIELDKDAGAGLQQFLQFIRADGGMNDIRFISYLLATTLHECRSAASKWKTTWQPVGETSNRDGTFHTGGYGQAEIVTDWELKPIDANRNQIEPVTDAKEIRARRATLIAYTHRHTKKTLHYPTDKIIKRAYYGRGYVQVTHQDNYRGMDEALGLNGALHLDPDKALEPQISYRIASYGMLNGSFRGKRRREPGRGMVGGYKLADYFKPDGGYDYTSARDIINGDRAKHGAMIATYAEKFEAMFRASFIR